jgi:hypothetical protein
MEVIKKQVAEVERNMKEEYEGKKELKKKI